MISNARTVERQLLTRRCVCCGLEEAAINRAAPPIATPTPTAASTLSPAVDQGHPGIAQAKRPVAGIHHCPRCGVDLHVRPPRSYAEMEGLLDSPQQIHIQQQAVSRFTDARTEPRLMHRWLAFIFLALMGMLAIAYLAAAVVAV